MDNKHTEQGAVSLFAVIFAAMLLSIITISFMGLMLRDQRQATNHDLSQSAYDAALAGVEDAKRVLRACMQGNGRACTALKAAHDCRVIQRAGIVTGAASSEVMIRSTSGRVGQQFDQAYTCVNITSDTDDYLYEARDGLSHLVPLRSRDEFDRVIVDWYMQSDLPSSAGGIIGAPAYATSLRGKLPPAGKWDVVRPAPPLMRAQMITPGAAFKLSDLDSSAASATFFFYPSIVHGAAAPLHVKTDDTARATHGTAHQTGLTSMTCSSGFGHDGYACRAIIELPTVSPAASEHAFMRLTALYKHAQVRVSLAKGPNAVLFRGVQPSVDATGRAASLFRRVDARIQLGDTFPYPEQALESKHSICKDFAVTGSTVRPGACTP